ncbi:hypothetical protein [Polynucleobacter sp.]|uniref:hypothetical protein n=1 Tax=Polynucleobacter sp. TaxID=2029855 RepID=UPI0026034504|nr:hypothetical protein [Polynucleobacter sp.]MCW1965645.1 hypothetical protein [Polynucleobacter sp.]
MISNKEATKNLPNAAVIKGNDWAKILPAMKVPPQNAATITSLNPSAGVSEEKLATVIGTE